MAEDSFAVFYRRYYRLVLTIAEQRLSGSSDAEDITAEVFRIAWKHDADGHELSLPWLYQVLRNRIGSEYRRIHRNGRLVESASTLLLTNIVTTPDDDDAAAVRQAINALPHDDRELIYMAYWEDLSGPEIAAILGCAAVTVRVRLLRARRKLKMILETADVRQEVESGRP